MNVANGARWLKRNWLISLLLVAILAALSWRPNKLGGTAEGTLVSAEVAPIAAPPQPSVDPQQESLKRTMDGALDRQRDQVRKRLTEKSGIQLHIEALDEDLEPDEYAAHLSALGNLYQQKTQDYVSAARYYELLIENHSDWPGINGAYHQLISCYTILNDYPSLRILYRKMLEVFPEETNEYKYAEAALAGKLGK